MSYQFRQRCGLAILFASILVGCRGFQIDVVYNDGTEVYLKTIAPDIETATLSSGMPHAQATSTVVELIPTDIPTIQNWDESTSVPFDTQSYPSLRGLVYRKGDEIWKLNENDQEQYLFDLPEGWIPVLRLSPDGNYLLYTVTRDGNDDIWASVLPSGETRNFTKTDHKIEQNPIWWPTDHLRVLYGYFNDRSDMTMGYGRLASIDITGHNDLTSMDEVVLGFFPAPSPDGETVAFQTNNNAWLYRVDNGLEAFDAATYGISVSYYYDASWSPDGKKLAWFISHEQEGQKYFSLAIFDLEIKRSEILHSYISAGCSWYRTPLLWSPDGEWITFKEYCPEGGQDSRLLLLEVNGQEVIDISQMSGPVWKDAITLAYHRAGGIWLFHLDERRQERISGIENASIIGWIPSE